MINQHIVAVKCTKILSNIFHCIEQEQIESCVTHVTFVMCVTITRVTIHLWVTTAQKLQ